MDVDTATGETTYLRSLVWTLEEPKKDSPIDSIVEAGLIFNSANIFQAGA